MGQSNYSVKEKAEALAVLQSNDGNKSKTKRDTGISRKTLIEWEKRKDEIMSDWERIKEIEKASDEVIPNDEVDDTLENAKVGENYELAKKHMANEFEKITGKAAQIVIKKIGSLNARDAMWVASTGLDKILKLKGEPDQVIEVRNFVVHKVISKLREAVDEGVIDKNQASTLSRKFDEIEEADYEEVN